MLQDKLIIGCCSDTHGHPMPSFKVKPDLILHAGDVYEFDGMPWLDKAMSLVEQVASSKVAFVRGNHDISDDLKIIQTCDLSGRVARLADGLWLVGIGMGCGSPGEVMTPTEAGLAPQCAHVLRQAEVMKDGDRSILLTHYPARMPGAKAEEGFIFDCVLQVAMALRPLVVIQGHTHRHFGRKMEHDGIKFVFPGPRGMLLGVSPDGVDVSL